MGGFYGGGFFRANTGCGGGARPIGKAISIPQMGITLVEGLTVEEVIDASGVEVKGSGGGGQGKGILGILGKIRIEGAAEAVTRVGEGLRQKEELVSLKGNLDSSNSTYLY